MATSTENCIEPETGTTGQQSHVTSSSEKSAHNSVETTSFNMASAWQLYKKLTMLPCEMGQHETSGKVMYVLLSIAAVYMLVVITTSESVYTHEEDVPDREHTLPDVLLCPFMIQNGETDQIKRKFAALYVYEQLRWAVMDIGSDQHLDALANFVRNKVEPIGDILEGLKDHYKIMLMMITGINVEQLPTNVSISDLHLLWSYLTIPSTYENLNGRFVYCNSIANTEDHVWCRAVVEPVWIGNSYCALFPFQMRKTPMKNTYWNIALKNNYSQPIFSRDIGIKAWIGNFQLQNVSLDNMHTVHAVNDPFEADLCFSAIHYDAHETVDFRATPESVRVTPELVRATSESLRATPESNFEKNNKLQNYSMHTVNVRETGSHWMFKVGLTRYDEVLGTYSLCDSLGAEFHPRKVTRTFIRPLLTTVQKIQLYGGVFGFTTGLSLVQLLELLSLAISNRIRQSLIRIGKLFILSLVFAVSIWLALDNLWYISSSNRFIRTSGYQILRKHPMTPHVTITQRRGRGMPMAMFNHSCLSKYNVSVGLLQYMSALSGTSIYKNLGTLDYSLVIKLNSSTSHNVTLLEADDVTFPPQSEAILPEDLFSPTMTKKFQRLAKQLGFEESVPPFKVYEQFRVDLCLLIKLCVYKQLQTINECCRYAHYETFEDYMLSDAITIRFPRQFQIELSGHDNGIVIYFDANVFREANYEYFGPDHIHFTREIGYNRANLNYISKLSLLLFDGEDLEQASFGRTTIDMNALQSVGRAHSSSFTIKRTILMHENQRNECRLSNSNCRVQSALTRESSSVARSLAEKTMCGCHICYSTAPSSIIERLWTDNGCCSASEATRCLKQPVTCCPQKVTNNGLRLVKKECCFDPNDDPNYACTNKSVLARTLLINSAIPEITNERSIGRKCSLNFEVGSEIAASRGSVVAQKLIRNDRLWFEKHNQECQRLICKRQQITLHQIESAPSEDPNTAMWSKVTIYALTDNIQAGIELDIFSVSEAIMQLTGGFGLLFGLSIITLFEMLFILLTKIRERFAQTEIEAKQLPQNFLVKEVLLDRVLRSVRVFIKESDQSITDTSARPSSANDVCTESAEAAKEVTMKTADTEQIEKSSNVQIGNVHSSLYLIVGSVLAAYAVKMLIDVLTGDNQIAIHAMSFNGTRPIPSIAICVPSNHESQLLALIRNSQCQLDQTTAQTCAMYFKLYVSMKNVRCAVVDNRQRSRTYHAYLRRHVDFQMQLSKNRSDGLETVTMWFGQLESIRGAQFTPAQEWNLSTPIEAEYELRQLISNTNCDDSEDRALNCPRCNPFLDSSNGQINQKPKPCCMQSGPMQIPGIFSPISLLSRCKQDIYTISFKKRHLYLLDTSLKTKMIELIDLYGVVEVFTNREKYGWSGLLSNLGTVIDSLIGVNALNVICQAYLVLINVIMKAADFIQDIITYYIRT